MWHTCSTSLCYGRGRTPGPRTETCQKSTRLRPRPPSIGRPEVGRRRKSALRSSMNSAQMAPRRIAWGAVEPWEVVSVHGIFYGVPAYRFEIHETLKEMVPLVGSGSLKSMGLHVEVAKGDEEAVAMIWPSGTWRSPRGSCLPTRS